MAQNDNDFRNAGIVAVLAIGAIVLLFKLIPESIRAKVLGTIFTLYGAVCIYGYLFEPGMGSGWGIFGLVSLLVGIACLFYKSSDKLTQGRSAGSASIVGRGTTRHGHYDEWDAEQERELESPETLDSLFNKPESKSVVVEVPEPIDVPEGLSGFQYMNYKAEIRAKRALEKK